MAIAPLTVMDTFSRTVSGSLGTSDTGHGWTVSSSNVSASGGTAFLQSSANQGRYYGRVAVPVAQSEASVLMKFRITSGVAWPLTDFGPTLNHNASNTAYGLAIQANYNEIAVIVFENGYRYELHRVPFSINKDVDYWVRMQTHASGVRARIWRHGTNEPSGWSISTILWRGGTTVGAGGSGFYVQGTRDNYTVQLDSYHFYTDDEVPSGAYPSDSFNGRTTAVGSYAWGRSSSGHVWEGAVNVDPEYYNNAGANAWVQDNKGFFEQYDAGEHFAIFGKTRGDDQEVWAEVHFGGAAATGLGMFRAGLRGTRNRLNNRMVATGYAAQIQQGTNQIHIMKYPSTSGGMSVLASSAAGPVIDPTKFWHVRFQIEGSTLRARYWEWGTAEPTTWAVTATDNAIAQGRTWISFGQDTAGLRTWQLYHVTTQAPTYDTVPTTKNFVTGSSVVTTDVNDTSVLVDAYYTNDDNNNSTIAVRYKRTDTNEWTNYSGSLTPNRTSKFVQATLVGLQPSTNYNIEVTYVDVDGVQGANPIAVVHTTGERGIAPNQLTVTDVTDNSISVQATYTRDSDNDSTATLEIRKTSTETRFVEDYFVDEREGVYLQNTQSVRGGDWEKHPSMTPEVNSIRSGRYFFVNTVNVTDKVLYTHSEVSPNTTYETTATFLGSALNGKTGIAFRVAETAETYYGWGINGESKAWEYFKMVGGAKTVLFEKPFAGDLDRVHTLLAVNQPTHRRLYLDGELVHVDFDATISETGRVGYYSTGIVNGTTSNQFRLGSFISSYRTVTEAFQSLGAMTVNRTTKTFTKTATGLDQDSVYELRVVFNDPDNVGMSMLAITAQTTGSQIELVAMGATTYPTSAIIDIFYDHDVNNNSYMTVQYKSVREYLWTTIAIDKVRADRVARKFSTTIAGLRASSTYEVRAIVTDPDGLMEGTPESLTGLFTTKGFTVEDQRERKSYLWKVYDPDGEYITTLHDAPTPDYSINENGGVTDLAFTLHRKMSEFETNRIVNYQNIIDIWCVDPSSQGMGPNLIADPDCDASIGAWVVNGDTFGQNSDYNATAGPDGGSALEIIATETQYETSSNPIESVEGLPLVISCIARAKGAKLRMYARAYDVNDVALDSSSDITETVGTDWQKLQIEYIPPKNTAYVRVLIRNTGRGQMWADKFSVLSKETLVYRGRIESYTPRVDEDGESVTIEALGLASLLSDDYIEFLQFVEVQPQEDVLAGRINYGAQDPADMFRRIIDEARRVNPFFKLYYTNESIRSTGNLMQYTFRDTQIRAALDKTRTLCPSGWHYFIEPDGLVVLRGPEHAPTHILRIGIEITEFEVEKSIRNLKNYIRVKGRQDEDKSEPDGYGSINYVTFDQASIDRYGKRALFIRDAQLVDPESAKIVGDGRLDEYNREEQRARATIPDEKSDMVSNGPLRGYNIESLRAGDNVIIVDPLAGPRNTYWDQFQWDEGSWDVSNVYMPLPESVPIKTIKFQGDSVELELSERPPSSVGDFSKLYRWMANKNMEG